MKRRYAVLEVDARLRSMGASPGVKHQTSDAEIKIHAAELSHHDPKIARRLRAHHADAADRAHREAGSGGWSRHNAGMGHRCRWRRPHRP